LSQIFREKVIVLNRRAFLKGSSICLGVSPLWLRNLFHSEAIEFVAVRDLGKGDLPLLFQRRKGIRISPGSIVKVITAFTALEAGVTSLDRVIMCPGWYDPPAHLGLGRLACWTKGHEKLSLIQAIAQSCNVHFYHLGRELGIRRLLLGLHHFQLGSDLTTGSSLLLATGQDPGLQVEPKQLLDLVTQVALRGQSLEQKLEKGSQDSLEKVITGMVLATQVGTCRGIAPEGIEVAAKTGTISLRKQQAGSLGQDLRGWVIAFWPVLNPRWAMVLLHHGRAYEEGIPLARSVIQAFL
jgi:penicillin-binding protein 2